MSEAWDRLTNIPEDGLKRVNEIKSSPKLWLRAVRIREAEKSDPPIRVSVRRRQTSPRMKWKGSMIGEQPRQAERQPDLYVTQALVGADQRPGGIRHPEY
jgi:hypothetical protein